MQVLEAPKKISFNWKKTGLIFSYSLLVILLIVSFGIEVEQPTQPYIFDNYKGSAGYYVISNHGGIKESYISDIGIALIFFIVLFLVQSIFLTFWFYFDKMMWYHNMWKITLLNILCLMVGFIMVITMTFYMHYIPQNLDHDYINAIYSFTRNKDTNFVNLYLSAGGISYVVFFVIWVLIQVYLILRVVFKGETHGKWI